MATKKFAIQSPYKLQHQIPEADYLHKEYLDNFTNNKEAVCQKPAVGVAIFGVGRAGTIHLSNIMGNNRMDLLYVVDEMTSKWKDIKDYWKMDDKVTFLTFKEASKVYNDPKVDIVVVGAPTWTHEEIVTKSLDAKKHVFCEKPITDDIESTTKCYEKAKKNGRALLAAFNRRFDPAYRSLKNRVRNGEVGHVQVVKVTARDSPLTSVEYLKTSGGIFHDCLVHDIDITCWLLGELPTKIQSTAVALIPEVKAIDDFDTVSVMMTYPSGTIAIADISRYPNYGYDQRLEAFGPKGMIKVENERPMHSVEVVKGTEGWTNNPIYYSFPSRFKLAYKNEMEHFLDVVQKGVEPDVKSWQTYAVSKIATAAEKSARTGETIYLDWSKEDIPAEYA